jgi:glycosyltransferase involved in cell wall biosynthesis
MKILMCHNYYQQPGGEDQVFHAEIQLLESRGHQVIQYTRHNNDISEMSSWSVARKTIWNRETSAALGETIRRSRPDVLYCTNTFPLISPAAYYAAKSEGVPVVQGIHNFRLFCPGSLLMRDGQVCEDCIGKSIPWPGALHGCYRNSRKASFVIAGMIGVHRLLRTWRRAVDVYIALTEFGKQKLISGGLPSERIVVKPNFLAADPGPGPGRGGYATFVGRLSPEKGIPTLLAAWAQMAESISLKIVGDGPLGEMVAEAATRDPRIEWLGRRKPEQVQSILADAACLLAPSLWYEGLPRTFVEAFAVGTPVITSRLGSMIELIEDGNTGLHTQPGDADDLADKVRQFFRAPAMAQRMRLAARAEFDAKYTADANYTIMMDIFQSVLSDPAAAEEVSHAR